MSYRSSRIIPRWAAGLVDQLVQNTPPAISVDTIAQYLQGLDHPVDPKVAITRLLKYGWLCHTKVQGVYAFIPPGSDSIEDQYIDLRAWSVIHPDARFCLAGASAAWHLGYLAREPSRTSIWLGSVVNMPKKLRASIDLVTTAFPTNISCNKLKPTTKLLRRRNLDLLDWAKGMPAFGPEALLVQISARPSSFTAWVDIVGRLVEFAADIDFERLAELCEASTAATRQRMVYLLTLGQRHDAKKFLPQVLHPTKIGGKGPVRWDAATAVEDYLIAPLLNAHDKA